MTRLLFLGILLTLSSCSTVDTTNWTAADWANYNARIDRAASSFNQAAQSFQPFMRRPSSAPMPSYTQPSMTTTNCSRDPWGGFSCQSY